MQGANIDAPFQSGYERINYRPNTNNKPMILIIAIIIIKMMIII